MLNSIELLLHLSKMGPVRSTNRAPLRKKSHCPMLGGGAVHKTVHYRVVRVALFKPDMAGVKILCGHCLQKLGKGKWNDKTG